MDEGYYEINQMRKNYPIKVVPHEAILENGAFVAQHWHRSIEIVLVRGDGFRLWVNGISKNMEDNSLAIINHGEFHSFTAFNGQNQSGCSVLISYTFLKELDPDFDLSWFEIGQNVQVNDRLRSIVLKMLEIYNHGGAWYNLLLRSAAYEMIYLLFTEYKLEMNSTRLKQMKSGEIYKEIINYIDKHYNESLRLSDVALNFGYHPDYFSKSFKNYIGENFTTHLKKLRLYNARKLLLQTDKPILEVALETGFSDSKAFIRDFKSFYGTTPLKYRKENSISE